MGADLIVFMLVGPEKLDTTAKQRARVKEHIRECTTALTAWMTLHDDHRRNDDDEDPVYPPDVTRVLKRIGVDFKHDDPVEYDHLTETDPDRAVRELEALWHGELHARDTCTRMCGKKQILVAGGTSFGDGPDGTGYGICETASKLGLFRLYGIK